MTVFYILWKSIDKSYKKQEQNASNLLEENTISESTPFESQKSEIRSREANQFTIDCGKSTSGLFTGLFILLATLISLITYFIYKEHNEHGAVILSEITELGLICLSISVIGIVYFELKHHKFQHMVRFCVIFICFFCYLSEIMYTNN